MSNTRSTTTTQTVVNPVVTLHICGCGKPFTHGYLLVDGEPIYGTFFVSRKEIRKVANAGDFENQRLTEAVIAAAKTAELPETVDSAVAELATEYRMEQRLAALSGR